MPFLLFVVSALLLCLELLQTKLFAYSLNPSYFYVVIAVVLLGLGASGSLLSLRKKVRTPEGLSVLPPPEGLVKFSLLALGALIPAAHIVFARTSDRLFADIEGKGWWEDALVLVVLALPYLALGAIVAAILSDSRRKISLLYALNLLGSAVGCVIPFVALRPLGAGGMLAVLAGVAALLAVPLCKTPGGRLAAFGYAVLLGSLSFFFRGELFDFRMQPGGQLWWLEHGAKEAAQTKGSTMTGKLKRAYQAWDPMGCVEVTEIELAFDPKDVPPGAIVLDSLWFTQDSSYGSPLIRMQPGAERFFEDTVYGAAYFRKPVQPEVLIIGLGGAPDVQTALHFGASKIVGVDMNQTTLDMVRESFAETLGRPYQQPQVEIARADGRSFLRRDKRTYDIIQLTGVDTKFVFASGNLAVHENYLYTLQAFEDYLRHLKPDGVLSVIYATDDYVHRLAVTAMLALQRLDPSARPERHVLLVKQGPVIRDLLFKRSPWTEEECAQARAWANAANRYTEPSGRKATGVFLPSYEVLGISVNEPLELQFAPDEVEPTDELMREMKDGRLLDWLALQPLDLGPVQDDRPYFFHTIRPKETREAWIYHLRRELEALRAKLELPLPALAPAQPPQSWQKMGGEGHPFFRQTELALVLLALGLVLTFLPLLWFRLCGNKIGGSLSFALYFALLGGAFILAEVGLIQRYVLFLGNQSYAFAVVIGGILLAAGLGALLSGRLRGNPLRSVGLTVLAILIGLAIQTFGAPKIFEATSDLELPYRLAIGFAALLPLGLPMGILFPLGLFFVRQRGESFVPWAIGINGVCSVLGSTLAAPLAITLGFTVVVALAGALYLCALFAMMLGRP
ncbi:MAG: hypothetical protein JNM84_18645 [Planctomycetes bacterium]|nr:hypothetical protein [Planctomycetota bacterium]